MRSNESVDRISSLLYVAMSIFVAREDPRYSSVSQTVSELSAVGAPTRQLWVSWSFVYIFLVTAFGWGIRLSAERNGALVILVTFGIFTGLEASDMEANLPTPWMGVWERINIGFFLLWVVVLAIMLLGKSSGIAKQKR
jgi:hypothetical protein